MSRYCPNCGAEYIDTVRDCSDCSVPLQDAAPARAEEEDHELLVYELNAWDEPMRTELDAVLKAAGVPYQWEGTDLLVPAAEEERVDGLLDQVEFPDAIEATVGEGDEDAMDDEAVYQVMSDLFVISDRMADSKEVDLAVAGDFIEAAAAAQQTPPPFGFEERLWQQIQKLATEISERLQNEEDDQVVMAEAATLRNALRNFV